MYENSKFALLDTKNNDSSEQEQDQQEHDQHRLNEFHYKGGVGIKVEPNNDNKVIPFSLVYTSQLNHFRDDNNSEIQVIPEQMFNKLFFSVAHEVNEKGNRKTIKTKKN